jgi:hypothetical protein
MRRTTIPENEWFDFINCFSQRHLGQTASIDVLGREAQPRSIVQNLPLQGISFDTLGTRPSSLQISVGGTEQHISHVVQLPLFLRVAVDQQEREIALEIEPAEGPRTVLLLH